MSLILEHHGGRISQDSRKMAHSKRNTSLAFFTAHERAELKGHWGSRTSRLTRESFLPFGSCQLCLLPARDPVACPSHGHLFCRECALENLLAQSKELKRLQKVAERRKLEDEEEKDLDEQEQQAKALEDFERVQAGLKSRSTTKLEPRAEQGTKRKAEDDADVLRMAKEGAVRRKLSNSKTELPSFWVPGETPDSKKAVLKDIKQHPTCPASSADAPHEISLKTLITVHFREDKGSTSSNGPKWSCPACDKVLSNSTKAILARPCGHVLCKACSDKFQKAALKSAHDEEHDEAIYCYVCQADITPGRTFKDKASEGIKSKDKKGGRNVRGMVELSSEGTGFAGGGKAEVKKQGVAFQC